jgi:mannosyltransferase OCH1-like enzyme
MIENNIHQIWVGGNRIPIHVKEYMEKVKSLHGNFNYHLWTDKNLPKLPDSLMDVYQSYNEPAIKADLLRIYVVYVFGGFYLDADFDTINGFAPDILPMDKWDGVLVYNGSYQLSALANSIFGFRKEHPLLKFMLDNIVYKQQWIGPNWWSQTVSKYFNTDIESMTIEEFKKKLNDNNVELGVWKDIEEQCFRHNPLSSWIHGSIWNEKLKNGDYD